MEPTLEQLSTFAELAATSGIIKRTGEDQYGPVKIAYHPYVSSKKQYDLMVEITKVWQKLLFVICADGDFFEKIFEIMAKDDPLRSNFLKINRLKRKCCQQSWFNYPRCDYMIGQDGNPKLVQINLLAVSMTNHSQKLQQVKKLLDCQNSHKYLQNKPNQQLVNSIAQLYRCEQLSGLFLMLVQKNQSNIIEQRAIELGLLQKGIKTKRITLIQATSMLSKDQDQNLICGNQKVAIAYFRAGYKIQDYQQDYDQIWKVRELIELSNAVKIPTVTMELFNSKRIQTELSKPQVYSKYLTKEQGQLLDKSIAKQWQFDNISQSEYNQIYKMVQNNKQGYVLKPNSQGGGNNFFKEQVYEILSKISKQQRKKYILMQLIKNQPIKNVIVSGKRYQTVDCDYQMSNYGVVYGKCGKLVKNQCSGFLIRIKPHHINQGGIMGGIGSVCSWMLEDQF